jgi:hypothetical protein
MDIKVKDLKQLEKGKTYIIQIPKSSMVDVDEICREFNLIAKIYGCSFIFLTAGLRIKDIEEIITEPSEEDKKQMIETIRKIIND